MTDNGKYMSYTAIAAALRDEREVEYAVTARLAHGQYHGLEFAKHLRLMQVGWGTVDYTSK